MKIHEYQAMALFKEYGIEVVDSELTDNFEKAFYIAEKFGQRTVVKAQVLTGGRGKAGGIKLADSASQAKAAAEEILSMQIKSMPVKKALIAKAVDIAKEYYLGITVDRDRKEIVLMMSSSGGVEIEELAKVQPEEIDKLFINPLSGIDQRALSQILVKVFSNPDSSKQASETILKMYKLFIEKDCSLLEINPYVQTKAKRYLALDAKINFDDNSLFKHPEVEALRNPEEYSPAEIEAQSCGLSFVSLEGDIGCIVNGAGLAMATMDIIKLFGAEPANFLDVGGSSRPDKVLKALEIVLANDRLKAILINIFGGITRCDDIAKGIVMAAEKIEIKVPLVIRLIGTNEAEGIKILKAAGLTVVETMSEAVKEVTKNS